MPTVFGITDDILIAGFNELGRDHGATLNKVLRICKQANLKLNKDKWPFRSTSIPSFGINWDSRKVQALLNMPPPKCKIELQSYLGKLIYLSKFSPVTASRLLYLETDAWGINLGAK